MSIENTVEEKHPSFGVLGFSRVSCTPSESLFGSPHKHHAYLTLTLSEATKVRSLSNDQIYAAKRLFKVAMSAAQFGELIAGFNVGDGVPVTIQQMGGKQIATCPEVNERRRITEEFEATCRQTMKKCEELAREVDQRLSGGMKAADRKALADEVKTLAAKVSNVVPFIQSQFNEALDKATVSAKVDVYNYFEDCVRKYGLEALQDRLRLVLDEPLQIADVSAK